MFSIFEILPSSQIWLFCSFSRLGGSSVIISLEWFLLLSLSLPLWATIMYILFGIVMFSSVQFSCSVMSHPFRPHELQHARPPCPSPTPGVYSNSCPSSRWCHPAISSSVIPFSSCPQSLPVSGPFQWVNSLHEVDCFCFGSIPSFFLELFLHWSPEPNWAPMALGSFSFSIISFCLLILFMWFSMQECWSGLPSPVDHILSDISTMTRPS